MHVVLRSGTSSLVCSEHLIKDFSYVRQGSQVGRREKTKSKNNKKKQQSITKSNISGLCLTLSKDNVTFLLLDSSDVIDS